MIESSDYTAICESSFRIHRIEKHASRARRSKDQVVDRASHANIGSSGRSLVILNVQVALDTYAFSRIQIIYVIGVVLPQGGVRVRVIVSIHGSLVDDLKVRPGGGRRARGRRGEGGTHDIEHFFHAVPQSVFQLLDDLPGEMSRARRGTRVTRTT
jgi:hypothetical protein